MMKYVDFKEKERINRFIHENIDSYGFSWQWAADRLGWSVTTIRKHYDKDWYPEKYYKSAIKTTPIEKELEYSGLYLLAQQVVVDGKIINLIKVGQSKNLRKRLMSYQGMNPFAKCIDTIACVPDKLDAAEASYHKRLGVKNQRYGNTEWFICSDEEYNKWLQYKFM